MEKAVWALGLMSGTSMDGIDAALIETDGARVASFGPAMTIPYDAPFRERLRSVLGGRGDVTAVERELTDLHVAAVEDLLRASSFPRKAVRVIGFHGHTILHAPAARRTWQIGDGARLADALGIDVVGDLRQADVTAGGQGAPLVPVYHRALATALAPPLAVLNIGGVANVTWIGPDEQLIAFDTGPGNALIDDWMMRRTGVAVDRDGRAAAAGRVHEGALARLLAHGYFALPPPKSLDRDAFDLGPVAELATEDGAATLARFTAEAVGRAREHFPLPPTRWLVCGGGRHNGALMAMLRDCLGQPVDPVEAVGWRGDAIEAEAFALMAVRSLDGQPISFPGTTGAPQPMTGGRLYRAARRAA